MAANAKSVSEKFERFKAEYLAHGNAYRAALAAGYSERMAKSKSWKLAKRVKAMQHGRRERRRSTNVNGQTAGFLPIGQQAGRGLPWRLR